MKKTLRSLLAYLLAAMLLVQSVPFAFAEGTMPSVMVADNTCTVGSNITITVTGKDFENLGALPLEFYYDADILALNSVTVGSDFQTYFSAINTNDPGIILVNLAYEEGITVSNATLVTLSFTVASDAAAGSTEIAVAVGDARDGDLNTMAVSSTSGTLTIKEKTTTVSTFRIYGSASPSTLSKGDTVKLQVYNWNWLSLAGGKFRVSFDDALFSVKSAAFDSGVLQGEYLTEINDAVAGQVTLSFISDTAASKWPLFSVDLEVIGDVDTTTSLTFSVIEAYDDNNVAYQTYSDSAQVTLVKLPEVVDYPNFSVSSTEFVVGEEATSTLTLEASDVAAADFSLRFDPEVLEVASVEDISTATNANAIVMVDETTWDSGVLNFSYMSLAGTEQDLPLLKISWNVLSAKSNAELSLSGTGVKDINAKDVTLEYVGETSPVYAAIYYDANGGSGTMADHLVSSGVTTTLNPNIFTRSGYIFTGWNTAANGTGTAYTDKASITVEATVTLYAQWEQLQARWGTVTGTAEPGWEGRGALDKAMTYANALTSGTAYIQLLDDVATDAPLVFNEGKMTILDLNGKTIDRGLENEAENGNVITVNGNLTLCDTSDTAETAPGKITGGCNQYGGGVYVSLGGTFTMNGGAITQNSGIQHGGGVYNEGTFVMTGGTISQNDAVLMGAGVYTRTGAFTLENGSISGNRFASHGGGVYAESGTFTMKGGTISNHSVLLDGAGVLVQDNCTFTMSGGSITGNVAQVGGGAEIKGTFVMSGGVIKGNTGEVAGGVYLSTGTMQISGAPIVSGNAANGALNSETGLYEPGETGRLDNVYLSSGKTISVGELTSGTSIGVTMYDPGIFTNGGADYADSSYFTSDNTDYKVSADKNGNLKLLNAHTSHPNCGVVGCTASHGHSDVTFEKLTTIGSSLGTVGETKSYYLRNDITVSSTITISGTVNLCLNGKTLALEEGKTGSVIFVDRGATLVLCDCSTPSTGKITGGNNNLGGGVNVEQTGAFVMNGGSICSNTATLYGGGVYTYHDFEMNGGTISENSGSGVYVAYGDFTMNGGSISENSDSGVSVSTNATFTMENGTISGNHANSGGGVSASGTFTMNNGIICGNTADSDGGGVYSYIGDVIINGGTISGNTAKDGGGVYAYSDFDMNGGTISGNNASNSGGGVWGRYLAITDGTVTGNTAGHIGGGVSAKNWLSISGDVKITDNTTVGKANNLHLYSTDAWIAFYDELSDAAKIGITLATIKENTDDGPVLENWTGAFTSYDAATYGSSFFSDNDDYAVSSNGNGQLTLVERIAIDGSVSIGGTVEYGQKLTATYSGNAGTNVTYQWYRDGAAISGATSSSYTLTTDDVGKTIRVVVTGTGLYKGTLEESTGTVDKATPSATAPTGLTATYGQTLANVALSSGWNWKEPATNVGSVGSHTFTAVFTPEDEANYKKVETDVTVTVGKAPLIVTANAKTITYGDAPANAGVSYRGFVNNETESVLGGTLSCSYSYTQYGNVGSYTITPSGVTADNYAITFVNGTLSVEQKEISIEWDNIDLTYNGKAQKPTATATGVVNEDAITLTVDGAKTDVGSYTATVTTIDGTKAGNYKLPSNKTTSFTIAPKMVTNPTIELEGDSFTYTGSAITPDVVSVKNGATEIPASEYTVSYSNNTNAGTATVTITDNDDGNYIVNGSTTFTITKADTTCTAPDAVAGLEYTGSAQKLITAASTADGTVWYSLSETGPFSAGIPTGTDAGTYRVYYKVVGDANHNDTSVLGPVVVKIAKQKVAMPTANTTDFIYNGKVQVYTAVPSDLYTISGNQKKEVGNYTVTIALNNIANYEWADGTTAALIFPFTIEKAPLTVTANAKTITYGDAPANAGVSYTGFVNNETASVLDATALSYSYSYEQYGNVGSYTITPNGVTADNYDITFVNGTLTVQQKEIGIEWDNTDLTYNGKAQAPTATATGTVNGDVLALTVDGAQTDVSTTVYTAAVTVIGGMKAGNYKLPSTKTTSFTINKASLTVMANAKTITYGDKPANAGVSYTGFVNGETVSALDVSALSYSYSYEQYGNVGSYTITPSGVTADNYDITFVNGTLSVEQKEIGIAWGNTDLTYNGRMQVPTATATGMVNEDVVTLTVDGIKMNASTTAYTATVSKINGDKAGNYKLPIDATTEFTISKADQDAPVVSKTDETFAKKADGVIFGVDATMEYSADGNEYTAINGEKIENLAAGTYYVRVKGDKNHNPSPATEVEIVAGRKLKVSFVVDGVTIATDEVDYGADVVAPEIPEKVGYTQTDPIWDKDGKNITTDTEINAVYTINKYTVTFKADGTIVDTQTIEHGSDAALPEIPTKEGYDETEPYWDKDGKNITTDTEINAVYTRNGVTVSGAITSYLSNTNDITVELFIDGVAEIAYTTTVKGNRTTYSIDGVVAGTYIMKVSKDGHVTREYTVVIIDSSVTQDVRIHPKGDVNCDGEVDIGDHQRLFEHLQGVNALSDPAALSIADVNEDTYIDIGDHQRLFEHLQGINPLS